MIYYFSDPSYFALETSKGSFGGFNPKSAPRSLLLATDNYETRLHLWAAYFISAYDRKV